MKIAAVIVTYNRKNLLIECIDSLLKQSRKVDKIFIIDNNSTDGTKDLLADRGLLNQNKISYTKLKTNIGGSGGFYEGIKKANQENFDWLWVMDDDVIVDYDALEQLLIAKSKIKEEVSFFASIVYGKDGSLINVPSEDSTPSKNGYPDYHKYLAHSILKISAATFVSILINNQAVNKIGYPIKDYFIWGDDTEYTLRLTRHYGPAFLVGKSKALHKRTEGRSLSIAEEKNPTKIKLYYFFYRNSLINAKEYFGKRALLTSLKYTYRDQWNVLKWRWVEHRFLKFHTIGRARKNYLFHRFNYKSFKNRFNKTVKWKGATIK